MCRPSAFGTARTAAPPQPPNDLVPDAELLYGELAEQTRQRIADPDVAGARRVVIGRADDLPSADAQVLYAS